MSNGTQSSKSWIQKVIGENEKNNRWAKVERGEGKEFLRFWFTNVSSGTTGQLSLASVPPGETVKIVLQDTAPWTLRDLDSSSTIQISFEQTNHGYGERGLNLTESVAGAVTLDLSASSVPVTADEACSAKVTLTAGTLTLGDKGLGDVILRLEGGSLGGGNFGATTLCGEITMEPEGNQKIAITSMEVHGEQTLVLSDSNPQVHIDHLRPSGEDDVLNVKVTKRESVIRDRAARLQVGVIEDLTIVAESSMLLVISKSAMRVTFSSDARIEFAGRAVGDRITFKKRRARLPRLVARPGAVLTELQGHVVLVDVRGAHLAGGANGFFISDIEKATTQAADTSQLDVCDGAFLGNFRIPSGLRGRSILNYFDSAHHIEPASIDLPGWELRYVGKGERTATELRHDAELMRKLRELGREKGASGSTRTKVGWCAQRLRHKTTKGRIERAVLVGYRCLGYGERPGPAFATWLVLSFLLAIVIAAIQLECFPGLRELLLLWVERAVSPVGSIVGSGTGTEKDAWLYLVRAVTAVPLVVGALSLRNYVKSG